MIDTIITGKQECPVCGRLTKDVCERCKDVYVPTPEEIREECRKIREGWSERETRRRAGRLNFQPYEVIEYKAPDKAFEIRHLELFQPNPDGDYLKK